MPALLFGSISALADTSELQRAAFNLAFAEHGLAWEWERREYQDLLTGNGGQQRIADYAAQRGEQVDAAAVHATKSRLFQESLGKVVVTGRPGVLPTIEAARAAGWAVGLVTTTSPENLDALFGSLAAEINRDVFDLVVDVTSVDSPKPNPAAYLFAVDKLGVPAGECVAIEDNVGGAQAASAAGVPCVVFANANTAGHDFGDTPRTAHLDFAELTGLVSVA